ncbi:MAG: hypothetical protein R3D34_05540 [Nitratireductor sp.]
MPTDEALNWHSGYIHELIVMLRSRPEFDLTRYLLEMALLEMSSQLAQLDNIAHEEHVQAGQLLG